MRKSTFFAYFLLNLLSTISAKQNWDESQKSGILHLSSLMRNNVASCHKCIVRAVGITQIRLLKSDPENRIYWIEGTTDIERAFVFNCNHRKLCTLSTKSLESYIPDYYFITDRLKSTTVMHRQTKNYVEKSIFHWSQLVISKKYEIQTAKLEIYTEESHQEHNAYLWKQSRILEALFFDEIGKEPMVRSMGGNSGVVPSKQSESPSDPSIRCIFAFNRDKEAVCRECLALHSTSLVIGTFHIFLIGKKPPVEVYVFSSTYGSEHIVQKCQRTFCPAILPLYSADCQTLHSVFPSDRLFLNNQVAYEYSSGQIRNDNRIRITRNGLPLDSMSRTLGQVAARRMSKYYKEKPFTDEQILADGLRIMTRKGTECVMVIYRYNNLRSCIVCVMGNRKDDAIVIINLSLTHATIVTDTVTLPDCSMKCRRVEVLKEKECSEYLLEHAMDIESHHRLLESPYTDTLKSSCMLLYHKPSRKEKCTGCVMKIYNVKEEPHPTTSLSSLFDASGTSLKLTQKVFEGEKACHGIESCRRLQQVPKRFCAEHRAYLSTTSIAQETRQNKLSTIHELTIDKISVGVWPPTSKHISGNDGKGTSFIHATPFASETGTKIWPFYSNIAFVEFTSAQSEELKCVSCLIQHSEVFFVYTAGNGFSGYVWMGQAPSHIFEHCLRRHCEKLTYDEQNNLLDRPVGLRQWSIEDVYAKDD
ncbi:unnamed protein product [Albugo candida]|uniref:Uncharacterized protein n=1 Tax=Albugo candida TaxID=65357 RepID=A0A024GSI5_9STRA|nr:unnamed protein product [Albugo candida]|eukprot:CCI49694.1 unnamed protein product [Albugo candida]